MKRKIKKMMSVLSALAMTIAVMPKLELPITADDTASETVLSRTISNDSGVISSDTDSLTKTISNITFLAEENNDTTVVKDYEINSTLDLKKDMTINGNAIITANVYLNGYTLTVTGDITHTSGTISTGGGTLNVGGNYEISSNGELEFRNNNDKLSIGGNFYQYNSGKVTYFNNADFVFTGAGIHEIHFDSTTSSFASISTPDGGKIKFTGEMNISNLNSDLTIVGDVKLDHNLSLSSHKLTIEGNLIQSSGTVDVFNNTLTVTGKYVLEGGSLYSSSSKKSIISIGDSFEIKGGTIYLGSSLELNVTGNVTQTGVTMYIAGGTLNVGGNYEISSNGALNMDSSSDGEVNVSKDFIMKSNRKHGINSNYFCYGKLSIGGNFYQYIAGTTEDNFVQQGTKIVFTGSGIHEIYFDSSNSYFTDISTPDGGKIKFIGIMHGFKLNNDLTIVGDTKLDCDTLDLNSHKLTIEGDFTQADGAVYIFNNAFTVTGKYILENGGLLSTGSEKSTILIGDSFEMNGGKVNLDSLEMTVTRDVTQTGGSMYSDDGTLNVGGNYEISSNGSLYMSDIYYGEKNGKVNVSKDFIMKSNKSSGNHFRYGTLLIGGSFYQYNTGTTENNFVQNGTNVVFTGSGVHKIHFDSPKSYFTNIEMDRGASISFEWKDEKLTNLFVSDNQILSISSNTVKAIRVGSEKLTVNYNDNIKSTISIIVRKSDNAEDILGDVNEDTEISVADIALLQEYLVKKAAFTEEQWKLADLNSDGNVNVFDIIIIKRQVLNS